MTKPPTQVEVTLTPIGVIRSPHMAPAEGPWRDLGDGGPRGRLPCLGITGRGPPPTHWNQGPWAASLPPGVL